MPNFQSVAIVGGGASGLLTAIQILSQSGPRGPRVYLIEKEETFGFGAAYATNDPLHLLNVRAGSMSAFPNLPAHFCDWLKANDGEAQPSSPLSFVTRQTYGGYLRSLLRDAALGPEAAGRFYLVPDEAVSILTTSCGKFRLRLALGKDIEADCVVLAIGNAPPHPPGVEDKGVLASPHYIGDPWSFAATEFGAKDGTTLILGTGLTMVDMVLSLERAGHRGPIIALSRRGLLPRRHAATVSFSPPAPPPLVSNIMADLRTVRGTVRDLAVHGRGWRDVIDSLRPITGAYWRSLPRSEQKRFLRHLRVWWEVHRHRLAPEAADRLDALIKSGQLQILRGRLRSLSLTGSLSAPVSVDWLPYAERMTAHLPVSRIINCMGPGHDPTRSPSPLMRQMLAAGLIKPDALGLGIAVNGDGRVIGRHSRPLPPLFALGPVTRGTFWEVTAIPDIRVKAKEVGAAILIALQQKTAIGV
jgi:uncharacterized NAD(P)/FAD-binding protein YdhS